MAGADAGIRLTTGARWARLARIGRRKNGSAVERRRKTAGVNWTRDVAHDTIFYRNYCSIKPRVDISDKLELGDSFI